MKKLYFKHRLFKKKKNLFNTKYVSSLFIYLFFSTSLCSGHMRNIKGVN